MPLPITHIFEVVDATDDERYYALGLYIDEQAAREQLDVAVPPCDDNGEDSFTVEVRKRLLGWHPHAYEVVAKRTWVREYPEDDSEPKWTCNPPRQHAFV